MQVIHPSPLLKRALLADAAVSGATAALQLLGAEALAAALQLPQALLWETGLFLVAYAALLVVLARSAGVWAALIGLVVAGNLGWAVACGALLATGTPGPNALGTGFVLVQVAAVLVFAGWEFKGLKASRSRPVSPNSATA